MTYTQLTELSRWRVLLLESPETQNSISDEVQEGIREAVSLSQSDGKGLAFRGANGTFSSGAHLGELVGLDEARAFARSMKAQAVLCSIAQAAFPSLALVEGHCIGKGFELALACKCIVASRHSYFWFPESALGFAPGSGGIALLERRCGKETASAIIRRGRKILGVDAVTPGIAEICEDIPSALTDEYLDSCSERRRMALPPPGVPDESFAREYAKTISAPDAQRLLAEHYNRISGL
ncbi:MAG: enoyl-CoA hydratase/isomerase family protein [Candidatus Brocadiia bacterium]